MMQFLPRTNLLNLIIKQRQCKTYLEIGVERGHNFSFIECEYKVGVDPDPVSKATIFKTSDEFFKDNKEMFDIIFLDGHHRKDFLIRDMQNAVDCLTMNGIILVHDVYPRDLFCARQIDEYEKDESVWNGDAWEGWLYWRTKKWNLEMSIIENVEGMGVIHRGFQNLVEFDFDKPYEEKFNTWYKDREKLSNVIDLKQFMMEEIYGI